MQSAISSSGQGRAMGKGYLWVCFYQNPRSQNQLRVLIVAHDYPSNLLSYAEPVNRKDPKNPWSTDIFPVDAFLYRRTIKLLA